MRPENQPTGEDLELVAAYIDGALDGEEKTHLERRLLEEGALYEAYASTLQMLEEDREEALGQRGKEDEPARVRPFPRILTWGGGAAAVAASLLLMVQVGAPPGQSVLAPVVKQLDLRGVDAEPTGQPRTLTRSPAPQPGRISDLVHLGRFTVDLEVAITQGRVGELSEGGELAKRLQKAERRLDLPERCFADLEVELVGLEVDGAKVRKALGHCLRGALEALGEEANLLRWGRWFEAVRLAAVQGKADALGHPALLRELEELDPEALGFDAGKVEALRTLLEQDPPGPRALDTLLTLLEELAEELEAMDPPSA